MSASPETTTVSLNLPMIEDGIGMNHHSGDTFSLGDVEGYNSLAVLCMGIAAMIEEEHYRSIASTKHSPV